MPDEGLSTRQKLLIVAAVAALIIGSTVIAHFLQQRNDGRLDRLWSEPWQWPERYHLVAEDEAGESWEVWFESPNRWYLTQPGGFQVSDGTTVSTYSEDGNSYTQNPVNTTYLQVGIGPIGPRDAGTLKDVLDQTSATWSVTQGTYLGFDVDVVRIARGDATGSGYVRTLIVDPARMVLLRESIANSRGENETYVEATSVDYGAQAPDGIFIFVPPEGSCLRPPDSGTCLP